MLLWLGQYIGYQQLVPAEWRVDAYPSYKLINRCDISQLQILRNNVHDVDPSKFGGFTMAVPVSAFTPLQYAIWASTAANCVLNSKHVASRSRWFASMLHQVASISNHVTCRSLLNSPKILSLLLNYCWHPWNICLWRIQKFLMGS
jgi:hypothetical protein